MPSHKKHSLVIRGPVVRNGSHANPAGHKAAAVALGGLAGRQVPLVDLPNTALQQEWNGRGLLLLPPCGLQWRSAQLGSTAAEERAAGQHSSRGARSWAAQQQRSAQLGSTAGAGAPAQWQLTARSSSRTGVAHQHCADLAVPVHQPGAHRPHGTRLACREGRAARFTGLSQLSTTVGAAHAALHSAVAAAGCEPHSAPTSRPSPVAQARTSAVSHPSSTQPPSHVASLQNTEHSPLTVPGVHVAIVPCSASLVQPARLPRGLQCFRTGLQRHPHTH